MTPVYLVGVAVHLALFSVARTDGLDMTPLERVLVPLFFALFWPIPASWALAAAIARRL